MQPSGPSFAASLEGKDAVTAVNQFCQRHCRRPITKEDIIYTSATFPSKQHQCTVKLNWMDGLEFAGEVCPNPKDAKQSAAQQVLNHFANTLDSMPAAGKNTASNKKKRAASTSPLELTDVKVARIDGPVEPSWKGELNQYFSKIVRRVIGKGEVLFSTSLVEGPWFLSYQSTVKLPGLPDHWSTEVFAGEVCDKKVDAEASVAKVALDCIKADPQLMALYNKPAKQNTWLASGGLQRQRERERAKAAGRGVEHTPTVVPQPGFAAGGMAPTVQTLAALGYYGNLNAAPASYTPGMHMGFS